MRYLAVRVALLITLVASFHDRAVAQLKPGELAGTDLLSASILSQVEPLLKFDKRHDKNSPLTVSTQMGALYAFMDDGDPYIVLAGNGAIDLGAQIALPSDKLVLKDFIWIYSRKKATLKVSDFPSALGATLQKLWLRQNIELLEAGNVLRAEPAGDILDGVRGFLMLDNLSGTTVLAFRKNKQVNTTEILLNGDIANPFGMGMTLKNPVLSYTTRLKEGNGGVPASTLIGLASTVTIKERLYDLIAEGDIKLKKPELFVLKTDRMKPDDLISVMQALARPLFPAAVGSTPSWNLKSIPSFELRPPTATDATPSSGVAFPKEDQKKVVVYAATGNKPEWGITGPAMKLRASLAIQTDPKQTIGLVEFLADAARLHAEFDFPAFTLPESNIKLASGSAILSAAAGGATLRISAATNNKCFNQKIAFTVGTDGLPQVDLNADQALRTLTPEGFAANFSGCAMDGIAMAKFALEAGTELFGFANDKLAMVMVPVFGPDVTLDAAAGLLGKDVLPALGSAAGVTAEVVATAWNRSTLAALGKEPTLKVGLGGGNIGEYVKWHERYDASVERFALKSKGLFATDPVLDASKSVFDLSYGGVASAAKALGLNAVATTTYLKGRKAADKTIAKALIVGGYGKTESASALASVLNISAKSADSLVDDAADFGGKACKTALGWSGIC